MMAAAATAAPATIPIFAPVDSLGYRYGVTMRAIAEIAKMIPEIL